MLGVICRFRYFKVGPFILEGGGWKNKKSFWKAFVEETLQKTSESKPFFRKKKVKKVANSGELYISFPIAGPFTVVGRCGMIPVLKSQ